MDSFDPLGVLRGDSYALEPPEVRCPVRTRPAGLIIEHMFVKAGGIPADRKIFSGDEGAVPHG